MSKKPAPTALQKWIKELASEIDSPSAAGIAEYLATWGLKVNRETVRRWDCGACKPSPAVALKLAKITGIPLEQLL